MSRVLIADDQNDVLEALGPGNSELLLGSTYNSSAKGVRDLFLYEIP